MNYKYSECEKCGMCRVLNSETGEDMTTESCNQSMCEHEGFTEDGVHEVCSQECEDHFGFDSRLWPEHDPDEYEEDCDEDGGESI